MTNIVIYWNIVYMLFKFYFIGFVLHDLFLQLLNQLEENTGVENDKLSFESQQCLQFNSRPAILYMLTEL